MDGLKINNVNSSNKKLYMKKVVSVLLTTCFLQTVVMAQSNITMVKEGILTKLFDSFLKAGSSKYDSLSIDSKLGVISIEFYNTEKQLFPMGLFPNDKLGPMPGEGKLILRISMIFHESFFLRYSPSMFSVYENRPVVFFTGAESLIVNDYYRKKFLKKYRSYVNDTNLRIISWIAEIDESNGRIVILEKGIY